jgi:hypothetical protein
MRKTNDMTIGKRASVAATSLALVSPAICLAAESESAALAFTAEACGELPIEQPYDYHQKLSEGPIHWLQRDSAAQQNDDEMALPPAGWTLLIQEGAGQILKYASQDFQEYLQVAMQVQVGLTQHASLNDWSEQEQVIVAGTPDQLPGLGKTLKGPKDYEIHVTPKRIIVCGFDERGVMYGLFNLEARMNLREGPFLPHDLKTIRHSLYQRRMVLSWLGWMEWPDAYLSQLSHDGFDAIFASIYSNPNGARIDSTEFYARILHRHKRQDPARVRDLIDRAGKFGIEVYAPIVYRFTDEAHSEANLRQLVRDNVALFPEIRGYVLLTEGFYYDQWRHSKHNIQEWARKWARAVAIVAEECHKIDPQIEVLPWEYNIDFRPQKAEIKRYFITQLPQETIPLVTWENGKSFEIDGLQGYLKDYSINQVGPAEVTAAQIDEAKKRGMLIYSKVDTFASWQFGTTPYIPAPYQWHRRYKRLHEFGVNGTLESWSNGYKPNFMTRTRAWYCWSEAPAIDTLLASTARQMFGRGSEDLVLDAWQHFSEAIKLVPDTGASMGTNFALANPLFIQEAQPRTMMLKHSWRDPDQWRSELGATINPYWPFTHSRMVFYPDFTNQINMAEQYSRNSSGIVLTESSDQAGIRSVLPVFNKYLQLAADEFEVGLVSYRQAAFKAPKSKRAAALKEVLLVEQMQRMIRSLHAILEFEDLRFRLVKTKNPNKSKPMIDRMSRILTAEIARTESSLMTSQRDSRLGYEFEQDYVYTPYVLKEKLEHLRKTRDQYLPAFR